MMICVGVESKLVISSLFHFLLPLKNFFSLSHAKRVGAVLDSYLKMRNPFSGGTRHYTENELVSKCEVVSRSERIHLYNCTSEMNY